ncbi:3-mercaptopyruvate sulfurtransferase [Flavobacterium bizetiae]|uniref:3-mercaptopyruvate sulfurtransferase n=1 Tax=Flavobacterium bizetiae TaxID=2704140 RepID=A0A6J4GXM3_9FLAO|nr:sulfurtransferase [Flavobacterium bizetiae]CAA9203130.1 3-mercaptopyruvate sulfurtransferase [Flavobacterium bizetiae]CAD5344257.1 3-mercaptopyruvate sulfurtransferase [Flavobacterium bizetiae]CAD5350751.1 3-mercaptopyruvate sulfurtransferase [Flavobacterium bizetiae]
MSAKLSPIINPDELLNIKDSSELILIDARAGINAQENYQKEHLKGARFVDLNKDLATIENPENGGRHPLPSLEKFSQVLSKLGISPLSRIIIYDDKNGSNAAARFWWMLRAIGHEKVQVLNGGLQATIQIGFPVNSELETFEPTEKYPVTEWKLAQADIDEVEKARKNDESIVIDVRDKNRFDGLTEPLDLIAGHIPGAVNVPFSENLDEDGFYKSAEVLAEKYSKITGNKNPENIIVHCGSGVTACHTLLAMDYAGLAIPKLYVGSWSEWSRNDRELATKK